MSDTSLSLLDRLRDRPDDPGWRRLVELYDPLIDRWLSAFPMQPADRDDVAQEVLATLVRELPRFRHTGRPGAFRHWLRSVLVNRLREFWRARDRQPRGTGDTECLRRLAECADPDGELSRLWDRQHDEHVARRLLDWIAPQFEPATCEAFRRVVVLGEAPAEAAAALGLSVNAVLIAKSRVLRALRREIGELMD
jgi:RNA polymerase sigma-70 factor (ECF subfamily)